MKTVLSRKGYVVSDYQNLHSGFESEITKDLIVKQRENGYSIPQKFKIYQKSNGELILPKYYGILKIGEPQEDKLELTTNADFSNVEFTGKLKEKQVPVIKSLFKSLQSPIKGGIICPKTGDGKTVMSIYCIGKLKSKTIIIVNRRELMEQWKKEINRFLPNAIVDVIQGNIKPELESHITIAIINTASMREFQSGFFNMYDLLIMDECHSMASEVFSRALLRIRPPYTIGLTATPYRSDGLMNVIEYFLGPIVYKSDNNINQQKDVYVKLQHYKPTKEYAEYAKTLMLGDNKPNITKMLSNICENPQRTQIIIEHIQELVQTPERHILLLADRIVLLKTLYKKLTELRISSGLFIGGMTSDEYSESKKKQVILGTYQICGTGFNLPSLNTLILASPRKGGNNITQFVGRILRKEHNINPFIIDIADTFSVFPFLTKSRKKFYDSEDLIKIV